MKVLLADDEALARDRMRRLFAEIPGWTIVAEAGDGDEAWQLCQQHQPDLLILDIRMPGMDGLQLAAKVGTLTPPPAIIFSTAHAEHALHAFQTVATAYLLKPVTRSKLRAALDKVRAQTRAQQPETDAGPSVLVKRGESTLRVPLSRVLFVRAQNKLSEVHHLEGVDWVDASLNQLEDRYPTLLRIHRNTLVNPAQVAAVEAGNQGHQLRMRAENAPRLAISRRLFSTVRQQLNSPKTENHSSSA